MDNRHEMTLVTTYPSGTQEWKCPLCGRVLEFAMTPPGLTVIEQGDVNAMHFGGSGGLKIASVSVENNDLKPWADAIAKLDFND